MPISVQRHLCNICRTEYRSFNEAMECETLSISEPQKHQIGESVMYEDENEFGGARYSYCSNQGIVLYAYNVKVQQSSNAQPKHVWTYVIKDSRRNIEVEATYVLDDFNTNQLVSLSKWKYSNGYSEKLKLERNMNY